MSKKNQHRVRAFFNEALEIDDLAQREAFLARICVKDQPLRQKLEKPLLTYTTDGDFLANLASNSIPNSGVPAATIFAQPGARIGRYKLLESTNLDGVDGDAWFSADSRFIALKFPKSRPIRVFYFLRQTPTIDLPNAGDSEIAMRFLPGGDKLVVIHDDGSCHEWDLLTRHELASWQTAARLESVDLSPDGRWHLTLGYGSAVSLYTPRNFPES